MNRSIRNLIVAIPLATAALAFTPGMASADGPVIVQPNGGGDPKPMDIAVPAPKPTQPKGPGEVSHGKPKPTHPKPNHPQGPGDISPAPKPGHPDGPGDITSPEPEPTHPDGHGDLSAPKPCPTHGVDCTPDNGDKGDQPQGNGGNGGGSADASHTEDATFATPTRVDAGTASAADQHGENGLELSFLLAGGALVTVTGAAFAARKRARA